MAPRKKKTIALPLLPLRDVVVFPNMVMPLFVGREKSVLALRAAMDTNKQLFLVTQKDPQNENPTLDDMYDIGVTANIIQMLNLPDGTVKVLVEGQTRAKIEKTHDDESGFWAELSVIETTDNAESEELAALTKLPLLSSKITLKIIKKFLLRF